MKNLEGKTIKKIETISPSAIRFEFTDGQTIMLKCASTLTFLSADTNNKTGKSPDTDEDYQWRMMVEYSI
jgi:hypothetical protein